MEWVGCERPTYSQFNVDNPFRRKQDFMTEALEAYARAYCFVLDWCRKPRAHVSAIRSGQGLRRGPHPGEFAHLIVGTSRQ